MLVLQARQTYRRTDRQTDRGKSRATRTVFDVADISDEEIADGDLLHLARAQRGELVLVLDLALKSAKLPLFSPVVKGRHQHDHHDRDQYRDAFDPAGLRFGFVAANVCKQLDQTCTQSNFLHVNYRWAKTHPLGQIAHPLQAFRPNGLVDIIFSNFGKMILRKIIKITATRCHILKLKCIKFDFDWGSAAPPQTPLGELTALPQTL